jgi:hypothetical protein
MSNIKLFEQFILEKKIDKVLYHGSPYRFDEFKNVPTFFSETPNFAVDYANQKSMDQAMDNDANLYTCKVKTEIFDITNPEYYKYIESKLPEKIKVYLTNFPIDTEIEKADLLEYLTGYAVDEPLEQFVNADIGDKIPDPSYKYENFIVVKKDEDYVYTISEKSYNDILRKAFTEDTSLRFYSDRKYTKVFEPLRDFLKEYINKVIGKNTRYFGENELKSYAMVFNDPDKHTWLQIETPSEESIKRFNDLYEQGKKELIDVFIEEEYYKKWNINPERRKLKDTWRYYENETVQTILMNSGFGGYIALENNEKTYLIFEPAKTVEIIKYQFGGYEFDGVEDYNNYIKYYNELYKLGKEKGIRVSYPYKYYKQNFSYDDALKAIKEENEELNRRIKKIKTKHANN